MARRRVVVTGLGAVSPLGATWAETWAGLLEGRSGIRTITRFDASEFRTQIAGEVRGDEPQAGDPSPGAESGRAVRLALKAAAAAVADSGLGEGDLAGDRAGAFFGCGTGVDLVNGVFAAPLLAGGDRGSPEATAAAFVAAARAGYDPRYSAVAHPGAPGAAVATRYGVRGPVRTHLTACAASAQAIGEAFSAIAGGEVDRAIAGGAHAMVHPDGVMAFSRLGALSARNDDPETASRPFDATRDGFVMGEGAAVLILESAAAARARGATPLAEVCGYGVTSDGYRATDPDPGATHVAAAISRALAGAGLRPEDVGYVSAHGTSTTANDAIETRALKMVLGEHAPRVPTSSVKSMIGHLIAAAGAIEAAVVVQALRDRRVPPTINLREPDPDCDLDYVAGGARDVDFDAALSNSFGFGGQNVCLAFRRG